MKKCAGISQGCLYGLVYILLVFLPVMFPVDARSTEEADRPEEKVARMADDTAKVNLLLKLGEQYCSFDNDKALMYLQEAYTISLAEDYTEGIGKSLMWQGRVYYYKSSFRMSDNYLDKAKKYLELSGDPEALAFWHMAKAFNLKLTGDYANAIEMFQKAVELSKQTDNKRITATSNLEMGKTLLDRDEVEKAMKYFNETLSLVRVIGDKVLIANALSAIAYAFNAQGQPDSSLYYAGEALKIRTELKMERHIASSEKTIGDILIKTGRYAEAEKSLRHALAIYERLNEKTGAVVTNISLAGLMNRQGKPEGLKLAERTLQKAKEINNPNLLSFVYNKLSEIYAYHNDYQKAYEYRKKYEVLKDSLFTSEKERMMAEVETKFQMERKDRDIALLKEKSQAEKNRNNLLIALLIVFLVVIFLLFAMFRYKSTAFLRQQKLLEQEKIIHAQENEIHEKENQLLQEQLESKNRELASKALEMIRMNETISEIIDQLEEFNKAGDVNPKMVRSVKKMIRDLETHSKENIWNEFNKIFKNIHSDFYTKLLNVCPELTATEIKTAALLKLNLTTKEIAAITFKSESGIKTTRYRLRKKLGLSGDDKLVPFLIQI